MSWLTGWSYRKKITITGQSGAGTDFQVLLKVGESSGSSGDDFHIEGNSESFPTGKDVGGDINFTSDDESTELKFWVEKIEGSSPNRTAHIWVKVTSDLDNNQDIYIYYGNDSADDKSDGGGTFDFYDVFDGDLDDNWTPQHANQNIIDGERLKQIRGSGLAHDETRVDTSDFRKADFVVDYDVYLAGSARIIHQFGVRTDGTQSGYAWRMQNSATDGGWFKYNNGSWSQISSDDGPYSSDTWYEVRIEVLDNNLKAYVDGSLKREVTDTSSPKTTLDYLHAHMHGVSLTDTSYVLIDNVRVRKLVETEPSFNSAGIEEEAIQKLDSERNISLVGRLSKDGERSLGLYGKNEIDGQRNIGLEGTTNVWRIERQKDGGDWVVLEEATLIDPDGDDFIYDDDDSLENGATYCYRVKNVPDDSPFSNVDCETFSVGVLPSRRRLLLRHLS
jgi:hypothetical protein